MGWGQRLVLWAAVAVGLAIGSTSGASAQCPVLQNVPPPAVTMKVLVPQVVYHHELDLFGLPKVERSAERPPAGRVLLGVTQLEQGVVVIPSVLTLPRPGGIYCVWVTKVSASLGSPVMNVYVAQEYEPGTCEYNVIMNHENTHVRFNLETLRAWAPTISAALTEAARRRFPAVFHSRPGANEVVNYLVDNVRATFQLMNQDMARRNATIDTPENYARENAKCHHWSRHNFHLDRPENNPPAQVKN
jgi:hypothetical protein